MVRVDILTLGYVAEFEIFSHVDCFPFATTIPSYVAIDNRNRPKRFVPSFFRLTAKRFLRFSSGRCSYSGPGLSGVKGGKNERRSDNADFTEDSEKD